MSRADVLISTDYSTTTAYSLPKIKKPKYTIQYNIIQYDMLSLFDSMKTSENNPRYHFVGAEMRRPLYHGRTIAYYTALHCKTHLSVIFSVL